MKRIDLLKGLLNGDITDEEADDICSDVLSDPLGDMPAHEALGMSRVEWTAYAQGAEFRDIANWRASGWPDRCFVCGQSIVLEKFGWLVREIEGQLRIKHVVCPKANSNL